VRFKIISLYCRPSADTSELFNSIVMKTHYEDHPNLELANRRSNAMPRIDAGLSTDFKLLNWYTFIAEEVEGPRGDNQTDV